MSITKKKVFVAMSGGVDSSVAAALLKNEGYDVTGVHMICWEGCENNQDKQDAMRVAAHLEIPFFVWDFKKEYKKEVFDYMISEYSAGHTPNPDVMCNRSIKFGVFLERALNEGADYIATGHHARLMRNFQFPISNFQTNPKPQFSNNENSLKIENCKLKIAKDPNKDQSYFLWTLTQDQLQYSLFPVGAYLKSEVRELARKFMLPTAEKKDSQGLCFVGKVGFKDFLRGALPKREGNVLNSAGEVLGRHDGVEFFTIGQRHGLNIGGMPGPVYVAERDIATNTLVVAKNDKDTILYKSKLIAEDLNWISGKAPKMPFDCLARIRYRQPLQNARIMLDKSSVTDKNVIFQSKFLIQFNEPQRAVADGQSVVFYELPKVSANENAFCCEMLGGGIIK